MNACYFKSLILLLMTIDFYSAADLYGTDSTVAESSVIELFSDKKVHVNLIKRLLDNFHAVQPGFLYRSKQLKPSRLRKYIQKFGIKTVINLRGVNKNKKWWQAEKTVLKELNVNYYNIPFSAKVISSKKNIQRLLYLYKHAPKPILIHCRDGADRSGEAAALWILERQGKRKKDAFKHLSIKYGYLRFRRPEKYFLISIWQGEKWLNQKYDPESYAAKTRYS